MLVAPQLDKGLDFTSSIYTIRLHFSRFVAFLQMPEVSNILVKNVFFFYYCPKKTINPLLPFMEKGCRL
jgi:hypothetical protein